MPSPRRETQRDAADLDPRRAGDFVRSPRIHAFLISGGLPLAILLVVLLVRHGPLAADAGSKTRTGFRPPDAAKRAAALGSTKGLRPELQGALKTDGFEPLTEPKPGDWLAEHEERGQTFQEFVRSGPNRPDSVRNRIYLLPIGRFDPAWSPKLSDLAACAEAFFQMDVKVLPAIPLDDRQITSRQREGYRQYLTKDLLALLRTQLPADAFCIQGLMMEDLYPDPKWNYVFGQASFRERVGIYSFARYDPEFWGERRTPEAKKLLLSRSCAVLVHETCHMFGMHHCIYFRCVVNGSNNLAEGDSQPLHLCPVCLRKLQHSTRFDVVKRYGALRDVYRRIGLSEEADWLEARLKTIAREN